MTKLTEKDWWYIFGIVVLAIFMGMMTPVWMQIPWLLWLIALVGLPV